MGKFDDEYLRARRGNNLKPQGLLESDNDFKERSKGHELGKRDRARDLWEEEKERKREQESSDYCDSSSYGSSSVINDAKSGISGWWIITGIAWLVFGLIFANFGPPPKNLFEYIFQVILGPPLFIIVICLILWVISIVL